MQRLASVFALALIALSAQGAAPTKSSTTRQIDIRNFHFEPARLVVPIGTTVTWTNRDEEPHIVTSVGNGFRSSPALDTNDHYSATFRKPGTYAYFCSIHPQMTGTIVVR